MDGVDTEARPERARRAGLPHERQITDQNLSRYLKSLKTERAKRKGQERKIGVAKLVTT